MKKLTLTLTALVLLMSSCGNRKQKEETSFTDKRDGQTYRIVTIGNLIWMAENLNYDIGTNKCYDNNPDFCVKYGRLYDWHTAMIACPEGWRLPTVEDWDNLAKTLGGKREDAGEGMLWWYPLANNLRAKQWYKEPPDGADASGFSALAGGMFRPNVFWHEGSHAYWWTATEGEGIFDWAHSRVISGGCGLLESGEEKTNFLSVRCVKDKDTRAKATAKTDEMPAEIDLDELTLRNDVYYWNNVPYTGKASTGEHQRETWEMKDGKFHGKYEAMGPGYGIIGNFKNGLRHGEWEWYEYEKVIAHYKDGKMHGEWKYFDESLGGLYKIETWRNDELISTVWVDPSQEFLSEGFNVIFSVEGNLNLDRHQDRIVVLQRGDENSDVVDRIVLILLGQADGTFKLAARNDALIFEPSAGGSLGDPFGRDIEIDNGSFTIRQMGGSRWMWVKTVTFKYNQRDQNWYLERIVDEGIDRLEPEEATTTTKTPNDFGRVLFQQFNIHTFQ